MTSPSIEDWFGYIVRISCSTTFYLFNITHSSSPGVVVANANSVGASLMVWLVSGILAWTGASSFAELGSAIPQNGGAQAYLSYAYGPLVSYLFAWTAIIALKPGEGYHIAAIMH
jgi:amino acid transporter